MNQTEQEILKTVQLRLIRMTHGEHASVVAVPDDCDPALLQMIEAFNHYLAERNDARAFITELAVGNLEVPPPVRNQIAAPYKQLHASLQHLICQTKQISHGDFKQRVHFLGEFSNSFNSMVEALAEKERTEKELQETRDQVKHLEGIIPICMYCKQIRDDEKSWHQLETYISNHSEAMFSHGMCPECAEKQMKIIEELKPVA